MQLLLSLLVLCVSNVCSTEVFISGNVVDHNALNLLEDIEEFYAHKFSEEFKVFSNKFLLLRVDFNPDVLDFGDRPLSKPTRVEVVLRNLDSDHSFEIVATFGNNEDFLWSRFNQTVLSPAESASFNVTFLPHRLGASEATIYIATSRGLLRYQVFGSAYPNPVDPFHTVRVEPSKQNYMVAVLDVFNPSIHTLKVEYLALCLSPPDTPETSDSCISQPTESCAIGNKFLYPHRRTELLRMEMTVSNFTSMRGLLVMSTSALPASPDSECIDTSCHTDRSFLYGANSKSDPSDWVTSAFPLHARYVSGLELFATTSLLDFGTLTSDSEPSVLTLDLINYSRHLIKITHISANGSHPALSLRIANQTIPGRSSNSYTVAVITVSAKQISSSAVLSGFITASSDDRRTYVKVPYYARLVYGTLATRIANSSTELPSPTGLRYQVFLQNHADIPLLVRQLALPRALQQLVTVHNQSNSSSVLQPDAEQMLLNLSVRHMPTAQVVGSLTVVTNISTINIPMQLFSGHIHVRIPTARLLSEVFDFGHVLLGHRRTTTIVLHNGNPFDLAIDSFLISTVATEDQILKLSQRASNSLCVPSCRLSDKGQTCSSCFEQIAQNSTLTYPVEWGGSQVAGDITGFLLLRSTHHQIIRQFRFHVGVGELTMLPDPMTINDLFPGKIVQRNIIVQSSYTKPAHLNRLALTTRSGRIPASLRLFDQHGELASDVELQKNPVTLSANKPTLIASVLFNPSLDCRDLLDGSEHVSGDQNQTSDPLNRDICFTGFNLNSNRGRELLSTMTHDHTGSDWRPHFRNGLFLTAQLYTSLRSAWVRKQVSIASEHQSDSTGTHISDAFVGFGVSDDTSLFWGDLAVSYTWPRIVSLKKPSARRGIVNTCVLKNSTAKSDRRSSDSYPFSDFGQPLRAHFPTTVWTEPVHCDLVIANPSDRPLVIQPFLLDAVYTVPQNFSKSCFSTDPLVGFLQTLGLPAAQETMSKLSQLIAGSFHIEALDTSQAHNYSTLDPDIVAPDCCPILLLPPRVGQVTFRLTFIPEPERQSSDSWVPLSGIPFTAASHNLLFIRNNLTALEPIWLNALQGKAALALGLVRVNQKDDEATDSRTDTSGYFLDNKQNSSSSVQVLLEARWNRAKFSGSASESTVTSDWTTSTNVVTEDTPALLFDFTERLFWPFCTEDKDPLFVYSVSDSDALLDWTDFHPFGTMLHSMEQRGEMLASVSIRRLIVLINTGDVPIYLKLLSVGPDDLEFSSMQHIEQIHPILESEQLTCSYAGFRLTPCILPREQISTPPLLGEDMTASSHFKSPYLLRPGAHLSLELRHHPDFVHTSFAARLWVVAHPQSSESEGKENDSSAADWDLCSNASSLEACDVFNAARQSLLRLSATFPRPFLHTCLNALPRPWIENLMWAPVVILFLLNLIAVLLMGSVDGSKIYTNHMKFRTDIDRFGFNSVPDPMHVFSFDRLTSEPGPAVSKPIESAADVKRDFVDRQQGRKKCLTTQPTATPAQSVDSGKSTSLWRFAGSLSRVFFWAGRTVLAVRRVTKVSALFVLHRILTPPPKISEPPTVTKATVSVVAQKKFKKAGSSPDARLSGSPASHISDTVGESDGDSGKLGRSYVSKTLASKSAGTRLLQSKTLISDEAKSNRYSRKPDASRGNVASDTAKPLLRKKKTCKSDPITVPDSISPCRDADSDTGNDTSSTVRGPTVQEQPDENDAPMTEARIAAAVRATKKLAEDLTSHARKKVIQNKQHTRSKLNACTSSASSSSGPDHDNPKISPTSTLRNPSIQAPTFNRTKQKGWHPSGGSAQLEETSDQPNINMCSRKAQLHQQCQSRIRPIGYSPVAYTDLFPQALNGFHYSVLQPEYGFCWPIPREASIPTQLLNAGAPLTSLPTPWDDAVADVNSIWEQESSEWNEDLFSIRASPDSAMDQIAAETRAFAESLLQRAPKDSPVENGLQASGAEDTSPLSMNGHPVFSSPTSSRDRSVHFSNLDPWANDFLPTSPWSPTAEDRIPMKSTAEVGTLTSPSVELPSLLHDAFEATVTAFDGVDPHSRCTTNLSACNICCGNLIGREEDDGVKQSKPLNGFDTMHSLTCSHDVSRSSEVSQTFFYELPQITQARRQSMLEHECRVQANEPSWHILAGLKRPENNGTSSEPEELEPVVPRLIETTTDSVVSSSKSNTTTVRRRGKQRRKLRNESSSPVVHKRSALFKDCVTLPTIRSPWSDQGRTTDGALPELPVFRPWKPLNAISTKELLRELGLDETDQLLSFGSSFSYHDYKAWDPLSPLMASSNPWSPADPKPTCE